MPTTNDKFDPRIKETPDLPGELYDEEEIPFDYTHARWEDDDRNEPYPYPRYGNWREGDWR